MRQDSKQLLYLVLGLAFAAVFFGIMAGQIMPPEQGAQAAIWQHYYHGRGIIKALLAFLGIAAAMGTIVSFCLMLLTVLRFDKEQ